MGIHFFLALDVLPPEILTLPFAWPVFYNLTEATLDVWAQYSKWVQTQSRCYLIFDWTPSCAAVCVTRK